VLLTHACQQHAKALCHERKKLKRRLEAPFFFRFAVENPGAVATQKQNSVDRTTNGCQNCDITQPGKNPVLPQQAADNERLTS